MIVAIAGGVGGAKLADGLAAVLGGDLSVVVNTGDDFEHFGLAVSPKADAGLASQIEAMEMRVRIVPTLMRSSADRRDLALACLDFAYNLASEAAAR